MDSILLSLVKGGKVFNELYFELYFEMLLSGVPQSTFIQAGTFVLDLDSIVLVFDEKNLAKT